MSKLKLCFAGTPNFAADHLCCLLREQFHIAAVYTQPDRRSGRGKKLLPGPVKQIAQEHNLAIRQPSSLRSEAAQSEFRDLAPDLLVVVAYGLILPQEILDIPKFGCINVHASLLPRWRGAAPIERALLAGDKETGVTIMQMDVGLDTGAMLHKERVAILPSDNSQTLTEKLSIAGQKALLHTLTNLEQLQEKAELQDESASTYAAKLEKSEALLDWNQTASQLDLVIRAGIGRNPAYTFFNRQRIRIIAATVIDEYKMPHGSSEIGGTVIEVNKESFTVACKESLLRITRVQLPGKKVCSVRDLFNSNSKWITAGDLLSAEETQ